MTEQASPSTARPASRVRRVLLFLLIVIPLTGATILASLYYTEKFTGVSLFTSFAKASPPPPPASPAETVQATAGEAVAPSPVVSASPTGPEMGPEMPAALGNPGDIVFKDKPELNILVLGIDLNWTDDTNLPTSEDARSDTMFILHVSKGGKRLGMLSIPRDLYADLTHGHGSDRINAAYSYGGAMLSKQAVMHLLHTPIDHTMVVKLAGAIKLMEALGGVDMKVEEDMDYDDNWGHLHVHLKKGWQHLDPQQAIGYARFRHDWEGDRGRMRRQQQFIETLIKEVRKPENLARPHFIETLCSLFKQSVDTDMTVADMLDLSRVYQEFDRRRMKTGHVDGDDTVVDGQAVISPPSPAALAEDVRSVLNGENLLKPQDVDVVIIDASHKKGAAEDFSQHLQQKSGCRVVKVDDLPHKKVNSMLLVRTRDPDLYDLAPKMVPNLKEEYIDDANLDLKVDPSVGMVIILGSDWTPPKT